MTTMITTTTAATTTTTSTATAFQSGGKHLQDVLDLASLFSILFQ